MAQLTENQRRALDYLESISDTAAEIDDRAEHLRELREKAQSVGGYDPTTSRGRHGDHVDRVGRAAARIVDAENALAGLIEKYCAQYREAAALINQLDNVDDFVFLRARYFQRQKMEDIAVTLDVATAYVYRIRRTPSIQFMHKIKFLFKAGYIIIHPVLPLHDRI